MNTIQTATRRVAGVAAVSALTITGIVGLSGPAMAAAAAFTDARGDMSQGADIEKVRVINGENRLRVNVVHRDLVRSYESGSSIAVYLDTDRKRTGPEYVFQGATFEGGDYALLPAKGFKASSNQQVPLRGGTYIMRLDFDNDVARISIDQAVLKNPSKVRVEVKTGAELTPPGGTEPTTEKDWLGTPRSFTRWVAKG